MIHKKQDIILIFKFHFLNGALKEEALDCIKHILVTKENYLDAWKLLREHYENMRRLANQTIGKFLAVNNMKVKSNTE